MIQILGFLGGPLAWVMRLLYGLIQNYGWTIIVITFILRLLMFPLTMMQQKNQARMSAYQPLIQEIQKKWANDKNRQNQEVMKFQEENNIKMTAGCLPMIMNMVVLFSLIVVIQSPLTYMLQVDEAEINKGIQIVQALDPNSKIAENTYTQQSILIGEIIENPNAFIEGIDVEGADVGQETVKMDPEAVEQIKNFRFNFLGLNLAEVPKLGFNTSMILPILSVLTMFASQFITMKTSGQNQMGGQMWIMTIVMGLFFGWYAFTVPTGFSLYYTASNVVMTLQQFLVKRIYDPENIKQQIIDEIEEKKKAKKAKKKVAVKDESGKTVEKEVSDSELVKIRLAKARELDEARYSADVSAEDEEKAEKARKADEEKYSGKEEENGDDDVIEIEEVTAKAEEMDAADEEAEEKPQGQETKAAAKPGRRKRARQNKQSREQDEDSSFAERERTAEAKQQRRENNA